MAEQSEQVPSADVMRLYALIGSIVSCWSHLKQQVDVTLWWLAVLDPRVGSCLTAQIQSLSYRMFALVAMLGVRDASQNLINEVNKFSSNAEKLALRRNRAIHDPISAAEDEDPVAITITARRKLVYGFFPGKIAEYEKTEEEITLLLKRYIELDQRIRADFDARRDHIVSIFKRGTD